MPLCGRTRFCSAGADIQFYLADEELDGGALLPDFRLAVRDIFGLD